MLGKSCEPVDASYKLNSVTGGKGKEPEKAIVDASYKLNSVTGYYTESKLTRLISQSSHLTARNS
jgi:hypothetical protein